MDINVPARILIQLGNGEPSPVFTFSIKAGEHFPEAPELGPMLLDQHTMHGELAAAFREAAHQLEHHAIQDDA